MAEKEPNNRCNAILEIDGFEKRKVSEFDYEFSQSFDTDYRPTGAPRGGMLRVKVDAYSNEGNVQLLNWMLREDLKKTGKILVYKPSDPNVLLKTIEFQNAYCIYYKETWKDLKAGGSDASNTEEIKIIWGNIKIESIEYSY